MMVEMAASNTLIQAMVPNVLRGRVMAVYSMMFMGMAPFGALFAGWLAERIGAPLHGRTRRLHLHRRRRDLFVPPAGAAPGGAAADPGAGDLAGRGDLK